MQLRPSVTLRVNQMAKDAAAAGIEVAHLGFGESDLPIASWVFSAYSGHVNDTHYPPIAGSEELRSAITSFEEHTLKMARRQEAVSRWLPSNLKLQKPHLSAKKTVVTPGSKAALFALLTLLPGDLLLPCPSWPPYAIQALLGAKKAFYIPTIEDGSTNGVVSWSLTVSSMKATFSAAKNQGAEPKILLLNYPNSPTGTILPPETLRDVCYFAEQENLIILSDEIYAGILFPKVVQPGVAQDLVHVSPALFYPQGTIIVSGISKLFSVGGWRLGYAIMPDTDFGGHIASQLAAYGSEIWSSASAPVCAAAETIFTRINLERQGCVQPRFDMPGPTFSQYQKAGAFYLYPNFSKFSSFLKERYSVSTSSQLSFWLMRQFGLATVAGEEMGEAPEVLCIRLATSSLFFASSKEKHQRGQEVLQTAIDLCDDPHLSIDYLRANLHFPRLEHAVDLLNRKVLPVITGRLTFTTTSIDHVCN